MLAARTYALLAASAVVGAGCSSSGECNLVPPPVYASFELTCGSTDLTSVAVSGPCETDAGPAFTVYPGEISIASSPTPGVCHVELTFATGLTYTVDVTYALQPFDCNGQQNEYYVAPTQNVFTVDNPSTTCVDSGPDGASDSGDEG